MSQREEKWYGIALKYATDYARTRRVPKQHNVIVRAYSLACCPLVCGACCIWSTLARFVACPCQCICNDPRSCCSNNSCTDGTDACMGLCIHETLRNIELPIFRQSEEMSRTEIAELMKLVDALLEIFEDPKKNIEDPKKNIEFEKFHYDITENVVAPLSSTLGILPTTVFPSNAREILLRIRNHFESLKIE